MADANVSRIGQINQSGAVDALFLKVFSGEVLTSFEKTTVMEGKHNTRTITSGKSAQFPLIDRISAAYHTPGAEINGLDVNHNERIITIDQLLISHAFLASIDEAMNHYDVRGPYSTEIGRKLANQYDEHVLIEVMKASRTAENFSGSGYGEEFELGSGYDAETTANKAAALARYLFELGAKWDNLYLPQERYCLVRPQDYHVLVQNTDAINRDWGGQGSYSDGKVYSINGFQIISSPQLNTVAANVGTSGLYTYHGGNFSTVRACAFTPEAVGTVKLMNLATEAAYDIRRQGYLIVSKYACGHGVLRPECASTAIMAGTLGTFNHEGNGA